MQELMKHPYNSSKKSRLNVIETPGTGIFLMKERAKLYKTQTNRSVHQLSKRLNPDVAKDEEEKKESYQPGKRKNMGHGNTSQMMAPAKEKPEDTIMKGS